MSAIHEDLDGGDDRGGAIIAAAVVSFGLAAAVVAMRFYTRMRIVRVLGWEDWWILVALVLSLGVSTSNIIMACFGYGEHQATVESYHSVAIAKTSFALTVLYQLSLTFTKISILILYLRLLTWHNARYAVWVLMGIVLIYNIWGFITEMTICIPLSKLWEDTTYGSCHPISFTWAGIGLHIATDFLIFFLPIPVFVNVKMTRRKKMTVLAVFTVGFIACIVSIIRAVRIYQLLDSQDPGFDFVEISYWNLAEVNVSIICACLMTFKPLIAKFWPRWLGSSSQARDDEDDDDDTGETGEGVTKTRSRLPTSMTRRHRSLSEQGIVLADIITDKADDTRPSTRRQRSLSVEEIAINDTERAA
ncbi:hypothetical protein GE09DRAFT_315504 [Coniochaeta sp. 2T2.1]|nr:hypothetical protein GE09DRAFT_315504 [Coniochaeta sp. 2T2.1]